MCPSGVAGCLCVGRRQRRRPDVIASVICNAEMLPLKCTFYTRKRGSPVDTGVVRMCQDQVTFKQLQDKKKVGMLPIGSQL